MLSYERRKSTQKHINRRIRQLQVFGGYFQHREFKQPHRLAKRKAFGCSRSQCHICHPNKF